MSLAIFDLDNTLIADDSDYLWGQFLVEKGAVDRAYYESANARFYEDYKAGCLDIAAFLRFSLKPLADHDAEYMFRLRDEFIETRIRPVLLEAATRLVEHHRTRGDTLMVITATNRFVTEPIVKLYGIDNLLATVPEYKDGRFTGRFNGSPCFQQGKVAYLENWLGEHAQNLAGSWFYSDSHNDLPLLTRVDNPVAVDPDETLKAHAQSQGWQIISLR